MQWQFVFQQFVLWITRMTILDKYSYKLCETLMIKVKQVNARTNFHSAELLSDMILPLKYAELGKKYSFHLSYTSRSIWEF